MNTRGSCGARVGLAGIFSAFQALLLLRGKLVWTRTHKTRLDEVTHKTRLDEVTHKTRPDEATQKTRLDEETPKTRLDEAVGSFFFSSWVAGAGSTV